MNVLKDKAGLADLLIGTRDLFAERASFLVDFRNPKAMVEASALCEECMLASPRLAVVLASRDAESWTDLITQQHSRDPEMTIEKV